MFTALPSGPEESASRKLGAFTWREVVSVPEVGNSGLETEKRIPEYWASVSKIHVARLTEVKTRRWSVTIVG
jgi:hypothetical protein